MKENTREYLPAFLNLFAAACVFLFSFLVDFRFSLSREITKAIGFLLVGIGMSLVLYAALYIKGAFLGEVEPRLKVLVKDGPYRMVRHPVYLGMTIALAGIPVSLRSWAGLIGVLVLFLPSEIYRAKLEEKALSNMFGSEWDIYAAQTGFILPLIGKK
jgi:protein-S-isoprenylcysteine O-methyltransferase Ste14